MYVINMYYMKYVLHVRYTCVTCTLHMCYMYVTHVLHVHYTCATCALHMCYMCVTHMCYSMHVHIINCNYIPQDPYMRAH